MSAGPVAALAIIRTHKNCVRIKFQKVPNSGSQIYILFANLFCQDCDAVASDSALRFARADNGADKFPCVAKGWWGKITLSAPPVAALIAATQSQPSISNLLFLTDEKILMSKPQSLTAKSLQQSCSSRCGAQPSLTTNLYLTDKK